MTSPETVSEAEIEAAAKVIAELCDISIIEAPKLPWPCWMGSARSILTAAAQVRAQEETAVLDSYAAENQRLSDERDEWKHKWMALAQASLLVGTMHAPDEPDALGIWKGE